MTVEHRLRRRLASHRLLGRRFETAPEVVQWLGAVQAQDFAGAKWGVAQRTRDAADADVEDAFTSGAILRTHVMRPTWHFVMPADIRWLLKLTGPRVNALAGTYYRKLSLDDRLFRRTHALLEKALAGGKHLTRPELASVFRRAGIRSADDPRRMSFLMMRAELDGVICSGPRRGKQFTYALLEERARPGRSYTRDESLAELVRRYFTSHGPATVNDFAWWSGLTVADGRAGLEMLGSSLLGVTIDGSTYWSVPGARAPRRALDGAHLLPAYDEALLSYRDNRALVAIHGSALMRDNGPTIVVEDRVAGTWRRSVTGTGVVIQVSPFARLTARQKEAIAAAAERYRIFLALPDVRVTYA